MTNSRGTREGGSKIDMLKRRWKGKKGWMDQKLVYFFNTLNKVPFPYIVVIHLYSLYCVIFE